jgi:AAA domain
MNDRAEDDDARLRRDPVLIAVEDAAEATIAAAREAKDAALWAAEAVDRMAFDKNFEPESRGNGHKQPLKGKAADTPKADDKPKPPSIVIGAGSFMSAYAPLSYPLDGILPSGSLYGLTARQGTGKTAFMQAAALAVGMNRAALIGVDVTPGRVAYVTIENPDDFRMKLAVACYIHGISYAEIETRIAIVQGRDTPEQIVDGLKLDAEANGAFTQVCFDTFQAGFSAAGAGAFNENQDVLAYVTRLRPLTTLPGFPGVLVAFHPIKNATEEDLLPYGGGAIMNEIDGNLTLWKNGQIKLGHNRVRGPEFEPRYFRIEKLSCPDIVDNKGRQILLPVMRPSTEMAAEERTAQEGNSQMALLKAMIEDPKGTQRDWAMKIGKRASSVGFFLKRLEKERLVRKVLDKWKVTPTGQKAAEQ